MALRRALQRNPDSDYGQGEGGEATQEPVEGLATPLGEVARGIETPRERMPDVGLRPPARGAGEDVSGGSTRIMPRKPSAPTPEAGNVVPPQGVMPFNPMGSQRGLFGRMGGLMGGGLGVPFDPVSNAQSNPLSSLIAALFSGSNPKLRGPRGI